MGFLSTTYQKLANEGFSSKPVIPGGEGGMLDAVSQLANNIVDGLLLSIRGGGSAGEKRYPKDNLNFYTNDAKYRDAEWSKSMGYEFQVYRVPQNGKIDKAAEANAKGWKPFRLQINPQELTQDEIFAIEVTPTFRGVIVEHHGTILKDIMISGTTGVSPMRAEGGAQKKTGKPVMQKGTSGFEEFHELRSYFRVYVEQKRIDKRENGELRLVFKNFKDNEWIYVEPQKFTMKRSSHRPFLYDYAIALKGIGHVEPLKASDQGSLFGDIVDAINNVTDTIEYATQVINGSVGLILKIERDVQKTLLGPLRAIKVALLAIKGGKEAILGKYSITRRFLQSFKDEIKRIENNCSEAFGRPMDAYNAATGRPATLPVSPLKQTTTQEYAVLNSFQALTKSLNRLMSERKFFSPDVSADNKKVEDNYSGKVKISTPNSVSTVSVLDGDNIQLIAIRELGDPDRFRDLVVLNNLKPPYISETGGPGVLKPGDHIMIPSTAVSELTGVQRNKEYNITKLMSEAERNLGVDIRLDNNNDLAISNTRDLDLIAGIDNFSQAILLKLFYEPGSLKRHREIGTGLNIGTKVRTENLNQIQNNIVSSFSMDRRVESIPYIQFVQEGNTSKINMVIKPKDLKQGIPIPITVGE